MVDLVTYKVPDSSGSVRHHGWEGMSNTDAVGVGLVIPGYSDKTVTIAGTFDSATVIIEGSNDPLSVADGSANWFTLTDPQGNIISKSSAAIEQITENPLRIRARTSGGGGSQDVNVYLLAKTINPIRT